jgi:hypothetical protein
VTLRPFLDCGVPTTGARCPRHTPPAKRGRTWAERKRRRDTVAAHIATHGNICPGHERTPHPSDDLTTDHLLPRSTHGDNGPLRVLCRSCNATKGHTEGTPNNANHTQTTPFQVVAELTRVMVSLPASREIY